MKYETVPTTLAHIEELAGNMRQADINEVWAAGHHTPFMALNVGFLGSYDTKTWLAGGKVMCIFGVGTTFICDTKGYPWMLSAKGFSKHYRPFLRGSRDFISTTMRSFGELENFVDARNKLAIRWLKWLGFDIYPPKPYGVDQLPFHRFRMEIG